MSQYQVVEFADGSYSVQDKRTGGYYSPPSFVDKLFGITYGTWWYSPSAIRKYATMRRAKAFAECRRLNGQYDRDVVRVVKTYSCE